MHTAIEIFVIDVSKEKEAFWVKPLVSSFRGKHSYCYLFIKMFKNIRNILKATQIIKKAILYI